MNNIGEIIGDLSEVEFISTKVNFYLKPTDDIRSKLMSGLVSNDSLISAYKEKSQGLVDYKTAFSKTSTYIPEEYYNQMINFIDKNIEYIDNICTNLQSNNIEELVSLIKIDQEMYKKLVNNNNIMMNNLAKQLIDSRKVETKEEIEEVEDTKLIIEESNSNQEEFNAPIIEATVYSPVVENPDFALASVDNKLNKDKYLFQISEIEKAINEIENKEIKTKKDITELYQYNEEKFRLNKLISEL